MPEMWPTQDASSRVVAVLEPKKEILYYGEIRAELLGMLGAPRFSVLVDDGNDESCKHGVKMVDLLKAKDLADMLANRRQEKAGIKAELDDRIRKVATMLDQVSES